MNKVGLAKRISQRTSLPYKEVLDFIIDTNDEVQRYSKKTNTLFLKVWCIPCMKQMTGRT